MRKIQSLLLSLLLSFVVLHSAPVKAHSFLKPTVEISGICWQKFTGPFNPHKSIYSRWPNITDEKTPLPEKTKKRVLSHPKVKELRASYKKGRGLTFDFSYLGTEASHKGELIQRIFLIKIIKLIFPKARIIIRDYNTRYSSLYPLNQFSKVHIPVEVADIRESMPFAQEEDFDRYLSSHINIMDMVLLKAANSSQQGLSDEYKGSFPAFSENSVLSLYLPEKHLNYIAEKNWWDESDLDLFDILDEFTERDFRKVFLTSHFNTNLPKDVRDLFLSRLSTYFDKILFLSRVSRKELSQITDEDRVLFFNDLTGYTPVLHSLADVTFIFGPVNILEGIFLDARVIFMNNKRHPRQDKYRLAFEQLKQTALRTNRAVHIENEDIGEIEGALRRLDELSSKPVVYPDEVILNPSKGDALNQLIERLHFQITENSRLSDNRFVKRL